MYDLVVEAPGFKKSTSKGIRVQVAQTVRIDVAVELGAASESVTVSATATMLKAESAEQSATIVRETLNALPLNFGGSGPGAIRNPLAFVQVTPGGWMQPGTGGYNQVRVNGAPMQSYKIVLEGQDATNALTPQNANNTLPAVDAIEEFTLQTSNFAAEFGQVVGGLFNFTTRGGTNQYHGSTFEYFANEDLNAGTPFTNSGNGHLLRPQLRKNDFGGSFGGPVFVPKVYNGRDKTFFFFTYEEYIDRKTIAGTYRTLPTTAMRDGDFSALLTGRQLNTDPLGRPIQENVIYDPGTSRTVNGQIVRDPFVNNMIPKGRIDPVAARIQALIPQPTRAGLVNNWEQVYPSPKTQAIPSIKIDQVFRDFSRLSFFYMQQKTDQLSGPDGLPIPITMRRDQQIRSKTFRLNYDRSFTPTLLAHVGIGFQRFFNPDSSPAGVTGYDSVAGLGLTGGYTSGFPTIIMNSSSYGGMSLGNGAGNVMGPTNTNKYYTNKPTAVASLSWVRGSHSYKVGGQWMMDAWTNRNFNNAAGSFTFTPAETALPSTQGQSLQGGAVGFTYASFLLGAVNSASVANPQDPQLRKRSWSLFAQDTWKVTRRMTLDYGLRWDYQGAPSELHDRISMFGPNTPNPSAGGLPGGMVYAGYGPGRCNCSFQNTYPFAIGPRIGVAYQLDPKTVLRGGFGVTYGTTATFNYLASSIGVGFNQFDFTTASYGDPALTLANGLRYDRNGLTTASLDPGLRPSAGKVNSPPYYLDANGGRPPRILQWSIGVQRELIKDLVVEANYVGNRGVWLQANSLINLNAISSDRLKAFGLDLNNAADRTLLSSRLDSTTAKARGFGAPYAGYPTSVTVAQSLRPYAQFGDIPVNWAPLGKNWYDSLQVKVTKRYSHGLDLTAAMTWQKELSSGFEGAINNVFNRQNQKQFSINSMPLVLVTGFNYQIPAPLARSRVMKTVFGDWTLGGILRYASGMPIPVPTAQNALSSLVFQSTNASRVPGQPLFVKDLNCHCIDPNKDFVLNPKAWSDPAPGQFGSSPGNYGDYRYARRYDEQVSLGRRMHIRESMEFSVRAEFFNVFNRTYLNNPDSSNALATQSTSNGVPVSGFGRINSGSTYLAPRSGQIVARFRF
jgi:hypothetical protein